MLVSRIKSSIRVREEAAKQEIFRKNKVIFNKIEDFSISLLKNDASVKTGRFKHSIQTIEKHISETRQGVVGILRIGPTASHSKYVVKRTQPSQGAYIPKLDARIKFGMHPGTPSNPIVKRNRPVIQKYAEGLVREEFGGRFDINKFFK